jgi:HAD superfamily hydrolase (TIGR01549 family)
MAEIKIVSFDLEGTLVTPDFSTSVWYEGVPALYASQNQISFAEASHYVRQKYQEVGPRKKEWYDIRYWFRVFHLENYPGLLEKYRLKLAYYPDSLPVLSSLSRRYRLVLATSTSRDFLPYLLTGCEGYFQRVFSSISDYSQLKCPEFYAAMCCAIGVRPEEVAHVGDSWDFDVLSAREAGIKAFYLDRSRSRDEIASLTTLSELETRLRTDPDKGDKD